MVAKVVKHSLVEVESTLEVLGLDRKYSGALGLDGEYSSFDNLSCNNYSSNLAFKTLFYNSDCNIY
ncbi:hypothetical protein HanRHA438_Chr08g0369741 [Helianthus annuus]|nr:hypothetical protein HanRHA438_Chr08g0369741 [Helianthus annuus]